MVEEVREALAADHPLHLLWLVSTIVQATVPDPPLLEAPEPESEPDAPDLDDLAESFIAVPIPETTALLAVLAELAEDPDLTSRCAQEVSQRDDELPPWIPDLAQTNVYRAVRMTHVLGDGDDLMLGVRLPHGYEMTCVVFIDHNMMSTAGDAFFVPDSLEAVLAVAEHNRTDADTELVEMSLNDACAWLNEALIADEISHTPMESDTWPACRPLVQWLCRSLPTGGSGYQGPAITDDEQREFLDRYFASLVGQRFDTSDHRNLLETCIEDGTGDPLRWSEVRVENLFNDAAVEIGYASFQCLQDLPDLLRAYIPFAHAEAGIRQELTAEALTAIDNAEAQFLADLGEQGD